MNARFLAPVAILGFALAATQATAQSIYIDFGLDSSTRPSSAYAAAAGVPGYWNSAWMSQVNTPLLDLARQPTQATLTVGGCDNDIGSIPSTTGDDEALLDDWVHIDCTSMPWGDTEFLFSGLHRGTYQVFVYPKGAGGNATIDLSVSGTIEGGAQISWPTQPTFAGSYVDWPVPVRILHLTAPGTVTMRLDSLPYGGVSGMQLLRLDDATPFCSGHLGDCPCGAGQSLAGCPTSFAPSGIPLSGAGSVQVSNDTLRLTASGVLNSGVNILVQGTTADGLGRGVIFGDGLRCAGGSIVRIAARPTVGGVFQYPLAGDLPLSVRGAVPATGGFRTYQLQFRNAVPYCTNDTINSTNGVAVQWLP